MLKRTESLIENNHCFRLKELQYFKEVLKDYDLAIIKQFILEYVHPIRIFQDESYQLFAQYRYIPHQDASIQVQKSQEQVEIKQGIPLSQTEGNIIAKEDLTLYRISLKTELVLLKLNYLALPILEDLKSCEKLMFLAKCEVTVNNFGTYIYRKDEPVIALYYLIEGQVKLYKKTKEKTTQLGTVQKDKLFGLYCLKYGKQVRELSAKASQNNTQVLVIYKEHLQQLCEEKQTSLPILLEDYRSELYSIFNKWSVPQRQLGSQQDIRKAELTLQKRIRGYHRQRNIKNKQIQKLIQTKSLLYKVRNLNQSIKKDAQTSPSYKRYAFDISTSSSRTRKIINNKIRHTEATNTPQDTPFSNSMVRSFVGLIKSASVRRYITKISQRQ